MRKPGDINPIYSEFKLKPLNYVYIIKSTQELCPLVMIQETHKNIQKKIQRQIYDLSKLVEALSC